MVHHSREYLINATISRIVAFSIGFIGCLIVLYYELKHRRTISAKDKKKQRWLLIWSMLTILCSTIAQLLFVVYALPTVCLYTTHLAVFLWGHKLVFLGLFQIRRLQVMFREDEDDQSKLPLLFRVLYCGAFGPCLCAILMLIAMTVTDHGSFGCIWTYEQLGSVVNWLWIFLYLGWDGTTLIVYIVKLTQYRRSVKMMMMDPENDILAHSKALYNKIKSALSKVILLTLVYEVTSTTVVILTFVDRILTHNEYIVIVYYVVSSIDVFVSGFIVYLMQKHNRKHYHAFLLVLNKLHFTFCCKTLARDANQPLSENTAEKTASNMASGSTQLPSIGHKQVSSATSTSSVQKDLN